MIFPPCGSLFQARIYATQHRRLKWRWEERAFRPCLLGLTADIGPGGWRRTCRSPTGSGPEGSSPNEIGTGCPSSLPPRNTNRQARPHERNDERRERPRLSRSRPQIPPADLRRPDRPGGDGAHPRQRLRDRPHRAGLYAHRRARRRQDDDGAAHRARPQLSAAAHASTCRR